MRAIEVKSAAALTRHDLSGLRALRADLGDRCRLGIVAHLGQDVKVIDQKIVAVPRASLLGVGLPPATAATGSRAWASRSSPACYRRGALTGLGCPTVPSYARLRPQRWACAYRVWGRENREAVLRLIPGMIGERAVQANAEFRAVDCAANPYLLAGALIAAGLEGVRRGLSLPAGVDGDPRLVEEAERRARGILRLPERLSEAASELAASGTMGHAMGDRLHDAVVEVRRGEAAADEDRPLETVVTEHLWRF